MVIEDYRENYGAGWIKLYRSIKKHWIWANEGYFRAWCCILLEVNHKDGKVLIQGELLDCKRGQSLNSLNTWASLFSNKGKRWSVQNTRTFLKLLESDGMIVTKGERKTTRLTVCNYDSYQELQQTNNRQLTGSQQTANRQPTTNKNEKKDKKFKKVEGAEDEPTLKRQMKSIWMEEFRDYDFKSNDWIDIASIRNNIEYSLKNKQGDKYFGVAEEAVAAEFKRIVKNFPEWYRQNALFLSTLADRNKYNMILNKIDGAKSETIIAHDPRNRRQ